jgi:hypothetical protein
MCGFHTTDKQVRVAELVFAPVTSGVGLRFLVGIIMIHITITIHPRFPPPPTFLLILLFFYLPRTLLVFYDCTFDRSLSISFSFSSFISERPQWLKKSENGK